MSQDQEKPKGFSLEQEQIYDLLEQKARIRAD